MWLLESEECLEGRQLWLRPGKAYLFGRTVAEPGQLAISHNTISRKHLTITLDQVEQGQAHNLSSRSKVTIEDLATKIGTFVNGQKIKGSKYVVDGEVAEFRMGKCPNIFRLTWFPVVFTFSFTNKELQTQPLQTLQSRFEQLDIKLLTDYSPKASTHVVSKKRNTAKGLQALIHGKHIVTETFLDAVVQAAEPTRSSDGGLSSLLENDFRQEWPDAMKHLPPRGGEPVQHPDDIYAPDPGRKDIFEGYTFIFYDQTQYNNLLAPITNGGGKALFKAVQPNETQVDDFVEYVKNVAGEKGSGSFDDGSEGKGVVLVRYLPAKGDHVQWYADFFTTMSLRLDHRPIEQNEFLEAILIKDASILRRPLETESQPRSSNGRQARQQREEPQVPTTNRGDSRSEEPAQSGESQAVLRTAKPRKTVKRRFAGFDDGADISMTDDVAAPAPARNDPVGDESSLFVGSQQQESYEPQEGSSTTSQRKRHPSPPPEDDLMEGMAPAVARFKRQRIERGDRFASATPEPQAGEEQAAAPNTAKKIKKEIDVLAVAAQHREQEEARARAEKEDLANLPDDVDLAEIRRLNIVEEMDIRQPAGAARTREQDIADGRWDPKWNGMKNFKKFRRRGEAVGRPTARSIVPLQEVKNKEFGVGDDYWLDDEDNQKKKGGSQPSIVNSQNSAPAASAPRASRVVASSSDEDVDEDEVVPDSAPIQTRNTRAAPAKDTGTRSSARNQTTRQTSQSQGKRSAPEPAKEQASKRPRPARKAIEIADSDDSDDDLKFRFGKRR